VRWHLNAQALLVDRYTMYIVNSQLGSESLVPDIHQVNNQRDFYLLAINSRNNFSKILFDPKLNFRERSSYENITPEIEVVGFFFFFFFFWWWCWG
jgi:hypothetical protein